MPPGDIRALPDEALQELCELSGDIERQVAWPHQCLWTIHPLLKKPAGGRRPIVLMVMLVRYWQAIRAPEVV